MKRTNPKKEFNEILEELSEKEGYYNAFDMLLNSIISSLTVYDEFNLKKTLPQTKKEVEKICKATVLLGDIVQEEDGLYDALGDFFMEYISNGNNEQYFTPQSVCDGLAKMQINRTDDNATINDPTCGSGRMLLAAAQINRNFIFFGSDIDAICCKMAVVNLALNNLRGEIVWGDPLKVQVYASYRIERGPLRFPVIRILNTSIQFPTYQEECKSTKTLNGQLQL